MNHIVRIALSGALMIATLGGLSGCGARKDLRRPEGVSAVPMARGAEEPETPDQLMRPSEQARPDRSAEPLKQSQERQVDPFDLPPS